MHLKKCFVWTDYDLCINETHWFPSTRVVRPSWAVLHAQTGRVHTGSLGGMADISWRAIAAGPVQSHRLGFSLLKGGWRDRDAKTNIFCHILHSLSRRLHHSAGLNQQAPAAA